MHHSPETIIRWYMGVFLLIWGAWVMLKAKSMNDIRDNFDDDPRPELHAVVERRQQLEARPLALWYAGGASGMLFGVATLTGAVNGVLAYAGSCLLLVCTLSVGYLRMRNAGPRRAAALVPRRTGALIAWPWYPIGVLVALSPLMFLTVPSQRISAVLVSLSACAIMALAIRAGSMAALLTGDHVDLELYVDDRLRNWRVNAFWTLGMGVAFVFVVIACASISPNASLLQTVTFYAVSALVVLRYVSRRWGDVVGKLARLVHP